MTKRYSKTIIHGACAAAAAAALILAGGLLFTGCKSSASEPEKGSASTQVQGAEYTCPMHPEVLSNRPGKCPQCGMNLEKKMPDGRHEGGHESHGAKQMHETGR
jgi:hypothetical protein